MAKAEPLFTPIRGHASFKDQAVKLLTDRIMSGRIKPGERLNESLLSQQLGISRAPIREALQQLLEQGLVVNIPRRGMFVVSLSEEDTQKINSLRLILETEALRLASVHITPPKVKKLSDLLKKIENPKPKSTLTETIWLDEEFHRTIWSSSGNEYLEKTLISLTAPLFAHRMVTLSHEKESLVLDTHRPIYDVVIGKSKETAEAVMLVHLTRRWRDAARYSSLAGSNGSRAATPAASRRKE